MAELNPRQLAFIDQYMITKNATTAAIKAGYAEGVARQQGSRLLSHADISAEIARRSAIIAKKYEVSAERVLAEISCMAYWDPAEMLAAIDEIDGAQMLNGKTYLRTPIDIAQLPEHIRRAIIGWKWTEHGLEVKFADKSKALDQLGRHLALFKDRIEVSVDEGLAERLTRAKARAGGCEG